MPFISYCPDSLSLNGAAFGEEVVREFEVHTVEAKETSPWLAEEQLADPKLRIFSEGPPAEEPLDSKTVRRVYKMKVAAVIPAEDEPSTNRCRHVIATLSKSTSTERTIVIESQVIPLVKAVPAVLNLTVANGVSNTVKRTVVVIDDREIRSGQPVRSRTDHDWLSVKVGKTDLQEER